MKRLTTILLVLFAVGCSKVENMPVVYFTDAWDIGQVKECQSQEKPNRRLVCSQSDQMVRLLALGPYSANSPQVNQFRDLLNNPKTFAVTFKGSGGSSIYKDCTDWKCRKTVDGISCE